MAVERVDLNDTSATSLRRRLAASPAVIVDRNMRHPLSISSHFAIKTESSWTAAASCKLQPNRLQPALLGRANGSHHDREECAMLILDWRKISLLILIGAVAAFVSLNAKAQWKPTKPITIIVPWVAGGSAD